VSAYFANGSFVDIARIEGGEVYKAYMLDQEKKFTKTTVTTARSCPLPKQLCQHWPFQKTSTQDWNPLTPMLKALFAAAEAALETDIRSAAVASYAMGDRYSGQRYLKSASDELRVMASGRIFRAIEELVPALHLEGKCENPDLYTNDSEYQVEGKRFLTIDYTRSSITAAIFYQECDYYEMLSRVRSNDFGFDAVATCRDAAEDKESCNADIQAALRKMAKESSSCGRKYKLDTVLVFGEKALDGNFAAILRKVLDNSFSNGASISPASMQDFSLDVAFAGSRAMAMFELRHKEWQRELAEEGRNEHGEL
jgi:hypothetical protein